MGKSKKRNRTRALYEAAAAAAAKRKRQQLLVSRKATEDGDDRSVSSSSSSSSSSLAPTTDDRHRPCGTASARDGTPTTKDDCGNKHASARRSGISAGKDNASAATLTNTTINTAANTNTANNISSSSNKPPSASDIATTLQTVRYLANSPDEFSNSKHYKELRAALHPLVTERLKSYDKGVDYRSRVTSHLSHQRWSSALSALKAAGDFRQVPKQGTVQRWIRDVDLCQSPAVKIRLLASILSSTDKDAETNRASCSSTSTSTSTSTAGTSTNKHDPALALIEAQKQYQEILQNGNEASTANENEDDDQNENDNDNDNDNEAGCCGAIETQTAVKELEGWRIPQHPSSSMEKDKTSNHDGVEDFKQLTSRIVYREKAPERTPPNHYDLLLHATGHDAVLPLRRTGTTPRVDANLVKRHPVPFVGDAFVLENVLSPAECNRLVRAASLLGYRPDHPTALAQPTGIDSCEWLVGNSVHELIYDRVREHLPATMAVGRKDNNNNNNNNNTSSTVLCGINQRWRFFRYGQGCVYRPHIDGSWPAGKLSEDGNSYERDETGTTRSYLTFLVYLNDDFEGGETKFYFPEATEDDKTNTNHHRHHDGIGLDNNNNNNKERNDHRVDNKTTSYSSSSSNNKNKKQPISLVARGIIPRRGSVLIFPQGNTASLLHEGSAVTRGTKYVVRTDVIYKTRMG